MHTGKIMLGLTACLFLSCRSQVLLFTPLSPSSAAIPHGPSLGTRMAPPQPPPSFPAQSSVPVQSTPPLAIPTPSVPIPSASSLFTTARKIRLILTPSVILLNAIGEKNRFGVFAQDEQGQFFDPSSLTLEWRSSRPNAISTDQNGTVKALQFGFATITVILKSDPSVTAEGEAKVTSGAGGGASKDPAAVNPEGGGGEGAAGPVPTPIPDPNKIFGKVGE